MSFSAKRRLIHTLVDIGPRRLRRRLCYDLRQHLDRKLPARLAAAWVSGNVQPPPWLPVLQPLESGDSLLPASIEPQSVSFQFLRLEQELLWPISWNDPNWPRLWQFHLHYFDWAREWLDLALIDGHWPNQAALLEPLLDHWVAANLPGRGDGWHSYTLSLRTRNWIWLFRGCPQLASPVRLQSLWQQLLWLQAHPEHCHGGNHWLENLTALALGGLQFGGPKAQAMHHRAMRLLQKELSSQVLADGGHEERSASYHLLMLDRLVELACSLSVIQAERPSWLVGAIEAMANWGRAVRLEGGAAPRFNDSAEDAAPPLDEVLSFADGYLQQRLASSGIRSCLLKVVAKEPSPSPVALHISESGPAVVTDLPATGWTLLRPGHGWELAFKCGVPCPPHLPPHVQSDQLSVELSYHGQWLLSEAGTSIYGNGPERAYERSGAAHNVLQLGLATPSGEIEWIEPVEVWGGFRAARKAQPRNRQSGTLSDGACFAAGSHDGFDRIGASHLRLVQLSDARSREITLTVEDTVTTRRSLQFRQWWHLAPSVPNEWLDP
ncbi:MAG: hypothetical protein FJ076_13475, partial [Cyanobacteria bacterium K_DeepCast_35m_m1_288]|nr:hypothetical protein [Cyanobacteria bacterium K_DeepCast_35m_m1_288]